MVKIGQFLYLQNKNFKDIKGKQMYTDSTLQPIEDNAPYKSVIDGTQYSENCDKSKIPGLTKVTETPYPEGKVVSGFTINPFKIQVWNVRDKTALEVYNDTLAACYSARRAGYGSIQSQLDMIYWDSINGATNHRDHITAVKLANPLPEPI